MKFFCIILLFISTLLGADYFVAPNGDDADSGTFDRPFATISKAAAMAHPGCQVIIREGVYRETIQPTNSGVEGQPIIFSAFTGGYGVGNFDWFQFNRAATGVQTSASPRSFHLAQNFPNPFNPITQIRYDLPMTANVKLEIFDALGRRVRLLVESWAQPGAYTVVWNGRDDDGSQAASGVYFYRLRAQSGDRAFEQSHKMLIIK